MGDPAARPSRGRLRRHRPARWMAGLARVALCGLLAAATVPAALAADLPPLARPSGLPWASGAKLGACLPALRGRALDANHSFIGHTDFPSMIRQAAGAASGARVAPLWVVSVPLLPTSAKGQFAACGAGAFDAYFRQIGASIQAAGAQAVAVRLGWEANIGSGVHPWGVDGPAQYPAYKACWRRAALAIKAGGPSIRLDWTSAKKGGQSIAGMYPGDDVVDVIGAHYYDSGPQKTTWALWTLYYDKTYNGGPWGIGAWLAFAKAHGKKLSVGEWGVWDQGQGPARADNPTYIEGMYRFFRDHAADVAYETYLNSNGAHTLCPVTPYKRAAARYRALWGAGL